MNETTTAAPAARRRWGGFGLAPKLVGITVLVTLLVAVVMLVVAATALKSSLTAEAQSKGEAIALSLATATEQSVGSSISTVQGSVDSNKIIDGVAYIFLEETGTKQPLVHTFSPKVPDGLPQTSESEIEALNGTVRVITKELALQVMTPDGKSYREIRALDVTAAVAAGALGVVHVGMDRDHIDQEVASLRRSLVAWGGAAFVLGTVLGLFLIGVVVVRPIRELTRVTGEIVQKGDLTQKIVAGSDDEIGQLATSFALMVEKLREIPLSLQESASRLAEAILDLDRSTAEQGQTITRQAAALQETQVTAQEIKQTSLLASQKAEAVLQVAERAEAIGQSGEEAIELSLTGLGEIRARVQEIAQKISQLNERTLQIGSITQTVKDLADQSNMLALNAAIEAVRSGEHGKGFQVVAREVRLLADQSIKATERVREILEDISSAITAAVAITEKGALKMETGLVQMKASGENLKALSNIVKDNSSAVRQIAAAVNQQNAGITQIFSAVTDLSKMMDDTVKRLDSTTTAASIVKEVSERMSSVVRHYQI